MDKVEVRTKGLSQALFSLATAGCSTIEVSVVDHAVKIEGIRADGTMLTLHIWSKEAEDTEAMVGKGEKLTEEEQEYLDKGKCPKCEDHGQTYKESKEGLAINVSCDAGHHFWIPPLPLLPEYLGCIVEVEAEVKEEAPPGEVEEVLEEAVEEVTEQENP